MINNQPEYLFSNVAAPGGHRAVITKRKPTYRFSNPDISSAVNLFIQRYPDEPRPEVAHSLIKHNVILLRNSGGMVAMATPDGNFLSCANRP
jgi:hypothetical protein